VPTNLTEVVGMYFLKTGSPAHLRWLEVFEPLMVITGIVQPLATTPSIFKLYFTHSQHASGQSLTTWSIFALASLLWVAYGLLNRKAAIYAGNIIGLVMNLLMVNGILMHAGWTY
jgi:MtN3 and saliva related transmembrane protein